MEPAPLTDEELAEVVWDAGAAPSDRRLNGVTFGARVQGLVAEVRRLRAADDPDLLEAARAIVAFRDSVFVGRPLSIDGRVIDHTLLNRAADLASRALGKKDGDRPPREWTRGEPFSYGASERYINDQARELRRLRGDEWLEAAADEIGQAEDPRNEAARIIRKHRDGRALDHAFLPDHHAGQTCAFALGDRRYCGRPEAEHRDGRIRTSE